MKLRVILFVLMASMEFANVTKISAAGYITEIINNTDEDLQLSCEVSASIRIAQSISLKTGKQLQPINQQYPWSVQLIKRTRNSINGCAIPIVGPKCSPNIGTNCVSLAVCSGITWPQSIFVALRQRVKLLELFGCTRIKVNESSNEKLFNEKACLQSGRISGETIHDGAGYSIEIKQRSGILYPYGCPTYGLIDHALEIIIKKNDFQYTYTSPSQGQPQASIGVFKDGTDFCGIIFASIKFDHTGTETFFKNFTQFLNQKLNQKCKIIEENQNGHIILDLKIYTAITREAFQNLLIEANTSNLLPKYN